MAPPMDAEDELVALVYEKGAFFLESARNVAARLCIGSDRQSLGRSPNDKLRDHRISGHGNSIAYASVLYHIWPGPMRNSANSMTLGAALAKR